MAGNHPCSALVRGRRAASNGDLSDWHCSEPAAAYPDLIKPYKRREGLASVGQWTSGHVRDAGVCVCEPLPEPHGPPAVPVPRNAPTGAGKYCFPLGRRAPRPGHSRPAALTTAGKAGSIGHRWSSRSLRIKQTRCHRVRPLRQRSPPAGRAGPRRRSDSDHGTAPRSARGVRRLHLGSALVILRAEGLKNSPSSQATGHFLIPGNITAVHRPMDPGSGVAPVNVCTPH